MEFIIFCVIIITLFIIATILKAGWKKKSTNETRGGDNNDISYAGLATIGSWVQVVMLSILIIGTAVASATIVDSGTVKVQKVFGKYLPGYIPEGFHFINPISSTSEISIQRQHINVDDGDSTPGMLCATSDNVQMMVQVNFAYGINKEYAAWIRREIGSEEKVTTSLLLPAAQSATRDASASFKLEEAQIKKRSAYEQSLKDEFTGNIFASLPKGKGLSDAELKNVIIIMPVQLKGVTADQKVANALSEKKAAEIDLERQQTLTSIAFEQANRMKNQGQGVSNMFNALPKGYSPEQMERIINALSNYKKAEAMMKAVESGKVSSIIYEGGAARTGQ